ncbi:MULTISPECIES: hypothetical protein [Bacillaceae]|uniref:Uncharacterized protein n=1 Tax=Oceanobacillus limi TaxID=930131 RepID=A0A1I0CWG4_9BACI|nr:MULTISPECIES: hypothetical protein [Bacillaceae]SET23915.1 hypothetical protein SAMN05216389_107109 [Oceanobacillus limi]
MKKENKFDYNAHYESILAIEEDSGKIKASDFLEFLSDLIIKYSNDLEMKLLQGKEGTSNEK